MSAAEKIFLQSLGCDKNRVDGEVMAGTLRLAGYELVNNPAAAAAIIINTCGFIRDAVQESLDAVFELAAYKKNGNCRALVVVGCMAERYKNEIKATLPEADAIIGVNDYEKIAEIVSNLLNERVEGLVPRGGIGGGTPKVLLSARLAARSDSEIPHVAYVKVAEGCDNSCAYCTIPMIRGKFRSRPMEEILEECRALVEIGATELVLVAQDTALYGTDIYGAKKLPALLREVAKTGAAWVRLMYVYPEHITPALLDALAETPQICRYIDMPIQHCDDAILARMGRRGGKRELEQLIGVLRERVEGIAIRTTFMVGFPGETEENFRNLLAFVKAQKFERMGVFPYSQEEGTPAAEFPRQVKEETKQARLEKLMAAQQKIHFASQRARVGKILPVIVDACGDEIYTGRTEYDAYEVDGTVEFFSEKILLPGQIVQVKITAADGYDLRGEYESSE